MIPDQGTKISHSLWHGQENKVEINIKVPYLCTERYNKMEARENKNSLLKLLLIPTLKQFCLEYLEIGIPEGENGEVRINEVKTTGCTRPLRWPTFCLRSVRPSVSE